MNPLRDSSAAEESKNDSDEKEKEKKNETEEEKPIGDEEQNKNDMDTSERREKDDLEKVGKTQEETEECTKKEYNNGDKEIEETNSNIMIVHEEENTKEFINGNKGEHKNESEKNKSILESQFDENEIDDNSEQLSENERFANNASREEDFFDSNFSDFQQAKKEVIENNNSIVNVYKALKKYEEHFLNQIEDSIHQQKPNSTVLVENESIEESPIDLKDINSICCFINGNNIVVSYGQNSIEQFLHKQIIRFTEQQKETNKKLRTNKSYYSVQDYINSLPSNPNYSIVKEFKGGHKIME